MSVQKQIVQSHGRVVVQFTASITRDVAGALAHHGPVDIRQEMRILASTQKVIATEGGVARRHSSHQQPMTVAFGATTSGSSVSAAISYLNGYIRLDAITDVGVDVARNRVSLAGSVVLQKWRAVSERDRNLARFARSTRRRGLSTARLSLRTPATTRITILVDSRRRSTSRSLVCESAINPFSWSPTSLRRSSIRCRDEETRTEIWRFRRDCPDTVDTRISVTTALILSTFGSEFACFDRESNELTILLPTTYAYIVIDKTANNSSFNIIPLSRLSLQSQGYRDVLLRDIRARHFVFLRRRFRIPFLSRNGSDWGLSS